jgi:tRNA-splicing ligase RtcB
LSWRNFQYPIKKVSDVEWRIEPSAKPGMRVPVTIYANEALLEKMLTDRTIIQGVNVTHLPGVQKHVVVLPDGHEGYGFPIGGVAATDLEEGVISPGGVGYDINCLPAGTLVLTPLGYTRPIEELAPGLEALTISSLRAVATKIVAALSREDRRLLHIKTRSGLELRATSDHPLLTPEGMVEASFIKPGCRVALHPFEGVPYEEPDDHTILTEEAFEPAVREELRRKGLLPLTARNPKLPYLIRLLGYFTGDGSFDGKKTLFYGSPEGLEELREDVRRLGFTPSPVRTRVKRSRIGGKEFTGTENSVSISAKSFRQLLEALGAPQGSKTQSPFTVPGWLFRLPRWMKRLYLAALFGAGLSKPQTLNGYNFYTPQLTLTKKAEHEESGRRFLEDIALLLGEFGVKTTGITTIPEAGLVRLKLLISETPENLLRLWSQVGYEYNPARRRLALAAVVWLRLKLAVIAEGEKAQAVTVQLASKGVAKSLIIGELTTASVNERFIERSLYEGRKIGPRVPQGLPPFEEWARANSIGDLVWDEVVEVREEPYHGYVYDLTVVDEAHNFVAAGFVVSNCGVRLIKTDLVEREVRPRLRELLRALFRNVPSGLGSRALVRLRPQELDEVLVAGVEWAVENGYGWEEDREFCEEDGQMKGADPSKVSSTAKQRGAPQLGSLGSGNHFLEVQKVDRIFDQEAAKALGIREEGQVVVMVHTGSRGFGHQVCSDYLRVVEAAARKYGIHLPDRELACAPNNSPEAESYRKAMFCALNFAWTNRQMITHWVRKSFEQVFKSSAESLGMRLIYDVAHNIAKIEEHQIDGSRKRVVVHRKGATRAFPKGNPHIPQAYRDVGQPVIIPGSMGTASWVLLGQEKAMEVSFGSTAHGAGRMMSRAKAVRQFPGQKVKRDLEGRGIMVEAASWRGIAEEAPLAYKNVDYVAEVSHRVGIATKVVRMVPIGVVKG